MRKTALAQRIRLQEDICRWEESPSAFAKTVSTAIDRYPDWIQSFRDPSEFPVHLIYSPAFHDFLDELKKDPDTESLQSAVELCRITQHYLPGMEEFRKDNALPFFSKYLTGDEEEIQIMKYRRVTWNNKLKEPSTTISYSPYQSDGTLLFGEWEIEDPYYAVENPSVAPLFLEVKAEEGSTGDPYKELVAYFARYAAYVSGRMRDMTTISSFLLQLVGCQMTIYGAVCVENKIVAYPLIDTVHVTNIVGGQQIKKIAKILRALRHGINSMKQGPVKGDLLVPDVLPKEIDLFVKG
eukprot:TRINITY_DN8068_c0_g1_i1.p1 TRINITY_DN8068_c0_g1~~TRINITY_DN8068_c0_g1_i1.p1  ORF type:complete len:344 (-),score=67.92 TRINITY_DN8068_c0_g1_i1:144-1031(-)